jgi:hypothetical protein
VFLLMLTVLLAPSAEAAPEAERPAPRGIRCSGLTTRATHFAEKGWVRGIRLWRKAAVWPCLTILPLLRWLDIGKPHP